MIGLLEKTDASAYVQAFGSFLKGRPAAERWLAPLRQQALAHFEDLGFPTTQDEDWRFTNVDAIAKAAFAAPADRRAGLAPALLQPFAFPGLPKAQLVFVDGRYAPALSNLTDLPAGVVALSLAEAVRTRRDLVEPHLARYAATATDPFNALNTAFLEDGAFIHVPRGAVLRTPIHLLYVATAQARPVIVHPRNLIVTGDNCEAAIVEDYVSLGGDAPGAADAPSCNNAVTEFVVGDSAVVQHYLLEREHEGTLTVQTLRVQQGRDSDFSSHSVLTGGALVRNNVHPVLAGAGAQSLLNGLFVGTGRQHLDNFMRVEHAAPHCGSRQFYKGILADKAHGVFSGRIIVHKPAQKTDAKQTNMNLLLSPDALIDTKPQLEIYADDVKCTHGATIGQIEDDAVFYLRSRGIPAAQARAILIYAFANESLERMQLAPIRQALAQAVVRKLGHAGVPEAAL